MKVFDDGEALDLDTVTGKNRTIIFPIMENLAKKIEKATMVKFLEGFNFQFLNSWSILLAKFSLRLDESDSKVFSDTLSNNQLWVGRSLRDSHGPSRLY